MVHKLGGLDLDVLLAEKTTRSVIWREGLQGVLGWIAAKLLKGALVVVKLELVVVRVVGVICSALLIVKYMLSGLFISSTLSRIQELRSPSLRVFKQQLLDVNRLTFRGAVKSGSWRCKCVPSSLIATKPGESGGAVCTCERRVPKLSSALETAFATLT